VRATSDPDSGNADSHADLRANASLNVYANANAIRAAGNGYLDPNPNYHPGNESYPRSHFEPYRSGIAYTAFNPNPNTNTNTNHFTISHMDSHRGSYTSAHLNT
jgi:hypothetical protein